MLEVYGLNVNENIGVMTFYEGREACVHVCREERDWFRPSVGMCQGSVMSSWLLNVYIDGVLREIRETMVI